jgi:hypothetical protein
VPAYDSGYAVVLHHVRVSRLPLAVCWTQPFRARSRLIDDTTIANA